MIIIDVKQILEMCESLLLKVKLNSKINAKEMIQKLLMLGNTEEFDISYWNYIESVLSPAELEDSNISKIATSITKIVELIVDMLETNFKEILGEYNPDDYEFVCWTLTAVCLKHKDEQHGRKNS